MSHDSPDAVREEAATAAGAPAATPVLQRARGVAEVAFKLVDGETRLDRLLQDGCCKMRFPRVYDGRPVAVLLNTAGGVTGGDDLRYGVTFAPGTRAVATTQAAERIYRRSAGLGRIATRLVVGDGAEAEWLPQETIVFDRAGLDRHLDIDLAGTARLTAVEQIVLGRTAMGETVRTASAIDRWRIRRDGRLVYADTLRLEGDAAAILAGRATGAGAAAMASLVHAGPGAEGRLEELRALFDRFAGEATGVVAGASAVDGLLVARLLAPGGRPLRDCLISVLENFRGRPVPRVWHC
ncbi:urease accessory protein UreD [Methylobrevis pamukkalensis]|uniref:Urease accessory protein UreD n=1 Tax=Methylobrevis pamukkalensis TaxID=1439726 RepID=A0A1E3GX62_9HYPH|nr:urease accessory protein UreD [Methylobrevis pamukkalensis]ODN68613.1 Urease accessory protein UreD [Methylobrevis pamukkalensis]